MDSLGAVYKTISIIVLACMCWMFVQFHVEAAELNTKLPVEQGAEFSVPINVDIPSQPLAAALNQLGKSTNLNIAFPSDLVLGKTAPAVKGRMSHKEALQRILANSGLAAKIEEGNAYIARAPENENENIQLDQINVRAKRFYEIGPLPGLGLTKDQIPGNVQSISAKEIKDSHSLSITDLMNKKLQSVTVNDYQGNPFQMDVQYRGFTAGPQIGTPQGLSVFFDGIRVNEPFGDVVNWDMIPMNALAGVDVFPGSNPIFGLNTLGGAFTLKTKDGFNNAGVDAEVLTGSFGRKQLQAEGGWNNGTIGLFAAGNFFLEDGWRENSPSKVNQLFTKASYRGDKLDLNLSTLWVGTDLVGNGLLPSEMYAQDRNASFTSEDTTKNRLSQFQLSSNYFVNDNFTITGQIYRRNSKRKALGADVYTDGFGSEQYIQRNLASGEQFTCLFLSTNPYKIPDYYVFDVADPNDFSSNPFVLDYLINSGDPAYDVNAALDFYTSQPNPTIRKNGELTPEYARHAQETIAYWKNQADTFLFQGVNAVIPEAGPITSYSNGESSYSAPQNVSYINSKFNVFDVDPIEALGSINYFYTTDGVKHYVMTISPVNKAECLEALQTAPDQSRPLEIKRPYGAYAGPVGLPIVPDGGGTAEPGVVEGTPVSILTDNDINQVTDGGSIQFNWNFEKHKFMVGASIDASSAEYSNSQRLGLLDENRKAYLAPDQIRDEYAAADIDIANNNFNGKSTTKSIYASETWSPIDTLHITGSARYNDTQIKNKVATRTAFDFFNLAQYRAYPDYFNVCLGSEDNCPTTGYRQGDGSKLLKPAETEKFSYYSLNPSFGVTWQAKENLNLYSNWSQGTRTPSVIELGCAFDSRPSGQLLVFADGTTAPLPRSLAENRACTLPTTLSGDPYLPQIKAETVDFGVRGSFSSLLGVERLDWNLGAYQTDLKDDIYLVSVGGNSSYFDTIGKTRRRGLEAGLSGIVGKASFRLNYSLTDATFQDTFNMVSDNNSSSVAALSQNFNGDTFRFITVKPGDRMPGVPLHNLNASFNYEVTPKWQVGLSTVLHSESFLRGNENNKHRKGVTQFIAAEIPDPSNPGQLINVLFPRQPSNNPGKVPGYATFNFQTSYKFSKEWTGAILINNLLDKEYFSAGRLGRNPFSPSINGAIGPSGYNHNSGDWLSTNLIAPGAPRGIWFSLNWQFDPNKQ
jgi:outer membrane receptor protein involved in Fe transport